MSELSCDTPFIGRNGAHDLSRYQTKVGGRTVVSLPLNLEGHGMDPQSFSWARINALLSIRHSNYSATVNDRIDSTELKPRTKKSKF